MKAPITQAQAWAMIAESAGWNAKELPVLPDQVSARVWIGPHWVEGNEMQYVYSEDGDGEPLYTISQLQAYGAACAAHAREMALSDAMQACKQLETAIDGGGNTYYRPADARQCVSAIEVLKGK